MIFSPVRTMREKNIPVVLAKTLNGQDRRAMLECLAGIPPRLSRQVPQATRDAAVEEFLRTLKRLAEQWIASGKDPRDPSREEPWVRNAIWFSDTYQEPIERTLRKFLGRHPLPITPDSAGRFAVERWDLRESQSMSPEDPLSRAQDLAIFEFQKFLSSDCPQRLFQCANCNKYFVLARKPRGVIQRGSFCKQCKGAGRVKGIQEKRITQKEKMLNVAAGAWSEWTPRKRIDQKAWAVQAVREKCGWIEVKWITRNLTEILKRVEELKDGKEKNG